MKVFKSGGIRIVSMLLSMILLLGIIPAIPKQEVIADVTSVDMYRLYNPNSGEHFYTSSTGERDVLIGLGWNYEGIGWVAPSTSNTPVYRLYNQYGGEHHYTTSLSERNNLIRLGWNDEGIGWYSDDSHSVPLYREYNPNQFANNHNYTTSRNEHNYLISIGWRDEGIGWYGIGGGRPVTPTPPPTDTGIEGYSYEIIPLLAPFNQYFYIRTDNPDPESFRFADVSSVYAEDSDNPGSITPVDTVFADVRYEDASIARVNGGYIAAGSLTDGGTMRLQKVVVTGSYPVTNITTGQVTIQKTYQYIDTNITKEVSAVMSNLDYVIRNYTTSGAAFFDNMDSAQAGFGSICLYSGTYVLGELKKKEGLYFGLSTSPHADQTFYIQDPYYREDSQSMLTGALYPFRYDSLGFPSFMVSVAKKLDPSATYQWDSYNHYIVHITCNGETRSYGGAGTGGGQGIERNMISRYFKFNGSSGDLYGNYTLTSLAQLNNEYGALEIPDRRENILTCQQVRNSVGTGGRYVRLILITSIFGGSTTGYTYLYDNGSTGEGTNGFLSFGHFSNAWFEGRYYNTREYWYPGAGLADTAQNVQPALVFRDFHMPLPASSAGIYARIGTPIGSSAWSVRKLQITSECGYDPATGNWNGFTYFKYNSTTGNWELDYFESYNRYRVYFSSGVFVGNTDTRVTDADFVNASVITLAEGTAMGVDANTNTEPASFLIYDRTVEPGTEGTLSSPSAYAVDVSDPRADFDPAAGPSSTDENVYINYNRIDPDPVNEEIEEN